MDKDLRSKAIFALSRFTGVSVGSEFIRKTKSHFPQAEIDRIHNLVEGIYKPASDPYAFCIWSRSAAGKDFKIYPDVFYIQKDGTWTMDYAAKTGRLDSAVNSSLLACLRDKVPILVIVTSRPSTSPGGAKYRILGPAILEDFDSVSRLFFLRGCSSQLATQLLSSTSSKDAAILQMRNQLIMPFHVRESRAQYVTTRKIRDAAFRQIILDEYRYQCSICQSKFLLYQTPKEPLTEAEAAHIISVGEKGPDDPRNGISLCKRHHWAFDEGLFTITDARIIKISPVVLTSERRRFDLEEYEGESILSPSSEACRPVDEAFHWHQKKRFRLI